LYNYLSPQEVPEFDIFLLYDLNVNEAVTAAEIEDKERQFMVQQQMLTNSQYQMNQMSPQMSPQTNQIMYQQQMSPQMPPPFYPQTSVVQMSPQMPPPTNGYQPPPPPYVP